MNIQRLNEQFGVAEQLRFVDGPGGLPFAEIRNQHATASISLHGGHVARFQPQNHEPVLFVSEKAIYAAGTSLRGGIPVCWPWFAAHPSDASKPFHGFVRTTLWQVAGSSSHRDGATELRLALSHNDATLALWPHAFRLELVVRVGAQLAVELVAHNPGTTPFRYTAALHSYFVVGDVRQTQLLGLEGVTYIDKLDNEARKVQQGAVTIDGNVDRIYLNTSGDCVIDDPVLQRRIRIARAGSHSTVVWNPWEAKAREMGDFVTEEYLRMLCVETTNAAEDVVEVAPGSAASLRAVIGVES
ncbi:MAG: D-hexose-6-phosphate mutarotase [Chloroflexaceae bacterium]|jgi:D-hexose-6-phosphate mutarotase|nr:D-hexose-6-phosphate mutarotase [Chloroflexaceae bacterium]